jgi:phospholipase D1/2
MDERSELLGKGMIPAVLREGRNCWRKVKANRVAFLIDGEAYFSALASTMEKAKHTVLIIGWDIDSRVRLRRDGACSDPHDPLGDFLNKIVKKRPGLNVYILDWDFAMLYTLEREPLPIFNLGWRTHRRLHFAMDGKHPIAGSHHQKIVVVDDNIAFAGGFDLAKGRWDTPAHAPGDPRRQDDGVIYPPFHDVQVMVEGEAAAALGVVARRRWRGATGQELVAPEPGRLDAWPAGLAPDLENVMVGISRTEPEYQSGAQVDEVKNLYLDVIAAARSSLYIENQYLTATAIGEALAARLQEKKGPEVVMVLPRECSGWLEETTMGVLRARLLQQLRMSDRHGRLKVFFPHRSDLGDRLISVHSKVMVADGVLVRIGSANLNNRSMGFDTECDLCIEAAGNEETARAIVGFRNRLLAEHLGTSPKEIGDAIISEGSLGKAIEALRGGPRTLEPLSGAVEPWVDQMVPDGPWIDPEKPARLEQLVTDLVPAEGVSESGAPFRGILLPILLVAALGLAAAWRWTPLKEYLNLQILAAWATQIQQQPWTPLLVGGAYLIGGAVLLPVTVLILVTALTFGPLTGFSYALGGCLLSALFTFAIGHLLGRETVRKVAGGKLNRVSRRLAERGLLAVMAVRILPVAPFTIVNLVAGASGIRLRDFALGTVLGMIPGIAAITLFEDSLRRLIERPEVKNAFLLGAVLLAILFAAWGFHRWLSSKERPQGKDGPSKERGDG